MNKIGNRRGNKFNNKMQNIMILILCFLTVVTLILGFIFSEKQNKKNIQLAIENNENKQDIVDSENSDNNKNSQTVDSGKLDNSNYLELKDDPNADDAAIVEENTKGLLTGNKQFPVRTDGKKVVYLTFDDGPSTTNTPQILDILDRYNVKATFFVLGTSLDKGDEAKIILKEIAKRGHAIGNHTYSHNYSYLYPNRVMNVDNIISDLQKNENAMKEVLGQDFSTRVIRLPGGYWSWEGRTPMRDKMLELGYNNIDWNALNGDAESQGKSAGELLQKAKQTLEVLGPNADSVILLMHDTYGKEETVKALPQIIEYLQSQGFEFRTIK